MGVMTWVLNEQGFADLKVSKPYPAYNAWEGLRRSLRVFKAVDDFDLEQLKEMRRNMNKYGCEVHELQFTCDIDIYVNLTRCLKDKARSPQTLARNLSLVVR